MYNLFSQYSREKFVYRVDAHLKLVDELAYPLWLIGAEMTQHQDLCQELFRDFNFQFDAFLDVWFENYPGIFEHEDKKPKHLIEALKK